MKIKAIKNYPFAGTVYNMGVLEDESYIVEGVACQNCRGIWVEILKDEAELPEIKGVPDSLMKRWDGGVNEFEQLEKPILDKDSIAWEHYKGTLDLTGKK